jgi:hypothetical protein
MVLELVAFHDLVFVRWFEHAQSLSQGEKDVNSFFSKESYHLLKGFDIPSALC